MQADAEVVNWVSHHVRCAGPFYSTGAPIREKIAGDEEPGEPLRIEGRLDMMLLIAERRCLAV